MQEGSLLITLMGSNFELCQENKDFCKLKIVESSLPLTLFASNADRNVRQAVLPYYGKIGILGS